MALYRIRGEFGGYVDLEVIDTSVDKVIERFADLVRAKCRTSGGGWAEDEIEKITSRPDDFVEELYPWSKIEGEFQTITKGGRLAR